MDGRKIAFIVIIVLIFLVFAAGTVLGASRSGGGTTFDPTQLAKQWSGLQNSLDKPPFISAQSMRVDAGGSTSADCLKLQGDLIAPAGQTCVFNVAPVEKSLIGISPAVRKLQLNLAQGDGAEIDWQGQVHQDNGNQVTVKSNQTLQPSVDSTPIDVYQAGGSLTIVCSQGAAAPACRLKLAK